MIKWFYSKKIIAFYQQLMFPTREPTISYRTLTGARKRFLGLISYFVVIDETTVLIVLYEKFNEFSLQFTMTLVVCLRFISFRFCKLQLERKRSPRFMNKKDEIVEAVD